MALGSATQVRDVQVFVILNPTAGHGNGARQWDTIEPVLRDGNLKFDLMRTTRAHEAAVLAENAMRAGYATIVVVGGDGTVNDVVNGMMRVSRGEPIGTLGVIPVGSGNDFISTLKFAPNWHDSVRHILAGSPRWVDVGRAVCDQPAPGFAREFYFANSMNFGFGAHAAWHAHDFRFLTGLPMYLAAVLKTLI